MLLTMNISDDLTWLPPPQKISRTNSAMSLQRQPMRLPLRSFDSTSESSEDFSTSSLSSSGTASPTFSDPSPSDHWNAPTEALFADLFTRTGRLDRFVRVMAIHPSYLESFVKAHVYFMLGDQGPLPLNYRFYIGILAASRHHCCYLVHKLILEYTLHGGDPAWLKGLGYAPAKLRSLSLLNKLMAHRPWTIERRHIEDLTKGSDPWSASELFHAVVILAHFHSLSSFVYGCGINPELDHPEAALSMSPTHTPGSTSPPKSPTGRSVSVTSLEVGTDASVATPASTQGGTTSGRNNSTPSLRSGNGTDSGLVQVVLERMLKETSQQNEMEELNQEDVASQFQEVEAAAADLQPPTASPLSICLNQCPVVVRFLTASNGSANNSPSDESEASNPMTYVDFCSRRRPGNSHSASQPYSPLKAQDFSWQECACSLANRLYADVGDVLDEKLRVIQNLTYKTFCDRADVDTALFRRAIWYYVHCLYGIRHDDFDYKHINQLLVSKKFKTYLKTAACYPERIRREDFMGWLLDFKCSEKVHISLMIAEARLESELIYVLRAFNAFLMP